MKTYTCSVCNYCYDPEVGDPKNNIPPGTPFKDLPKDWTCPICGVDQTKFDED